MAKWLREHLSLGNVGRRASGPLSPTATLSTATKATLSSSTSTSPSAATGPPQPPTPDYTESEILRAYRAQKALDFEDPYQCTDRRDSPGSDLSDGGGFESFGATLPNGLRVKVVSPKHRLIKVDSQEFGRCCAPPPLVTTTDLGTIIAFQEQPSSPVVPSAPSALDDSEDYSDPFDAQQPPAPHHHHHHHNHLPAAFSPDAAHPHPLRPGPGQHTAHFRTTAFSPLPAAGDIQSGSYMEPFEAQRVMNELQLGHLLYDSPYDDEEDHNHTHLTSNQIAQQPPPSNQNAYHMRGRSQQRRGVGPRYDHEESNGGAEFEAERSRLPQDDERPAEEYDQPWEWKQENISKALAAVQFESTGCGPGPALTRDDSAHSRSRSERRAQPPRTSPPSSGPNTVTTNRSQSSGPGANRTQAHSPQLLGERVDPFLPLEQQVWYHGTLTRSDAESLLTLCKECSYLVRNSQSSRMDYSLSIRSCHGFLHMKFSREGGRDGVHYVLGENSPPFPSIPQVIHYYTTHKLPIRGAEHLSLLFPVVVQTL